MSARDAGFDPAARFAWVEAPARWSRAAIPVPAGPEATPAVPCARCEWLAVAGAIACENCGESLACEAQSEAASVRGPRYVTPLAPCVSVVAREGARATRLELREALARAESSRLPGLTKRAVEGRGADFAHAHQRRAVLQALGPLAGRALFADEPGLGKTAAAALALREWAARSMVSRALVLAPRGSLARWQRELSLRGIPGFSLLTRLRDAARAGPLVLAPWGLLDRDARAELLTHHRWDAVVADDALSLADPHGARHRALARCDAPYLLLVARGPVTDDARGAEALCALLRAKDRDDPPGLRARLASCAVLTRRSAHDVALAPRALGRLDLAVEPAEAALWSAIREGISRSRGAAARDRWLRALRALCSSVPALALELEADRDAKLRALARTAREAREGACVRGLALALRELAPIVDGPVAALASRDETARAAREALARETGLLPTVCAGPSDLLRDEGPNGASAVRACRALVHVDLPWSAAALERRVARVLHVGADPSRAVPVLALCADEAPARWFALLADGSALGGLGPSELAFVERSLGDRAGETFEARVGLAIAHPERFDELARACSVSRAMLQGPRVFDAVDEPPGRA